MKKIEGGVTAAKGFLAAGVEAGIKYHNRKDMALVWSECPAAAAGTFTTNAVKAAPVLWDQQILSEEKPVRAVVLNSGIANACTGQPGKENNEKMAEAVAEACSVQTKEVLTASTGVIGVQLRMEPIKEGAKALKEALADTQQAALDAAEAIMTTDTVSKQCAVSFQIDGKTVHIGGMSKGSGMIHPNMATMLSVITTDACIGQELLQETLRDVVSDTFNMISVDRDTSTNDTCVILANGMSESPEIQEGTKAHKEFTQALFYVARELAKKMAGDGEGCTKLLEVTVQHAATSKEAKLLSKSVITSNLVKTALFGCDSNWGRVLCALGYSGAVFDPDVVDLYFESEYGKIQVVKDGLGTGYLEEEATRILSSQEVTVLVDVKQGDVSATAWGCDLTYDYVKINGDYRS